MVDLNQIWTQIFFFVWIITSLVVRYCCKLSLHAITQKTNKPNLRKCKKKYSFWLKFGTPKLFSWIFYLYYMLDIVASYHCIQFQGKLMNQTWENNKKPSFMTDFGPFGPNLDPKKYFPWNLPLIDVTHCYTSLQVIIVCNFKEN